LKTEKIFSRFFYRAIHIFIFFSVLYGQIDPDCFYFIFILPQKALIIRSKHLRKQK